jgi:hypothetical protein
MSLVPPDPGELPHHPWDDNRTEPAAIVEAALRGRDAAPAAQAAQDHATVGVFQMVWRFLAGYCPEWGRRLAAARVLREEAKALKIVAEGKKIFEEAEAIKAKTAMEMQERQAALDAKARARDAYQQRRQRAEVMERVKDAVSKIKQSGGTVELNPDDARRLLGEAPDVDGDA